jgi:serine O-acetyltransferase
MMQPSHFSNHRQIGFWERLQNHLVALTQAPTNREEYLSSTPQIAIQKLALVRDFQAIFERDPAARHWLEVLFCYPGFHALICHRLNHWLYRQGVPFFPRFFSYWARAFTGIEIHPAAQIGKGMVIDHGMGVVIGETAIVGDDCLIYQGVTLGGTGKDHGKRHPTIGNRVEIGAGAKILGNIRIGDGARIGAGSIILREVPSGCTAVGVPGRNICPVDKECFAS